MISTDDFYGFILPVVLGRYKTFPSKIAEFGNSIWGAGWADGNGKFGKLALGSTLTEHPITFWSNMGVTYHPFDINGINSIQFNLQNLLPDSFKNQYTIVFDFGTLEHIKNQYNAWKNCHNIVHKSGTMMHILPLAGYWKDHCYHWYTPEFFVALSKKCNYRILFLEIEKYASNEENCDKNVCAALEKINDDEFITEEEFLEIFKKYCVSESENFDYSKNWKPHGINNVADVKKVFGENIDI